MSSFGWLFDSYSTSVAPLQFTSNKAHPHPHCLKGSRQAFSTLELQYNFSFEILKNTDLCVLQIRSNCSSLSPLHLIFPSTEDAVLSDWQPPSERCYPLQIILIIVVPNFPSTVSSQLLLISFSVCWTYVIYFSHSSYF